MSSLRSFVAVPLPDELRSRVFAAAQQLSRELPQMTWSRKVENLHVTVKFLGKVEETQLDALAAALGEALGTLPRFAIEVRGMGAFPSTRHARVVWAGVEDGSQGLAAVAEAVEAVAARFGFAREQRRFTAHVTVARQKDKRARGGVDVTAPLASFAGRSFGTASVDAVCVYESRLGGAKGSTYVLRSRAALCN
jgi:2'-5' RNA ligase